MRTHAVTPYMEIPRSRFVAVTGRDPKMSGKYDINDKYRMERDGWSMADVTCIGDEIVSFEAMGRHVEVSVIGCCGRALSSGLERCIGCPIGASS